MTANTGMSAQPALRSVSHHITTTTNFINLSTCSHILKLLMLKIGAAFLSQLALLDYQLASVQYDKLALQFCFSEVCSNEHEGTFDRFPEKCTQRKGGMRRSSGNQFVRFNNYLGLEECKHYTFEHRNVFKRFFVLFHFSEKIVERTCAYQKLLGILH